MKKTIVNRFILCTLLVFGCGEDFLEKTPQGVLRPGVLTSREGIEQLLIATYATLLSQNDISDAWHAPVSNWVYGDVTSDDAHRGSDSGDQPQLSEIERYSTNPANDFILGKWRKSYDGIARANDVLRFLPQVEGLTTADQIRIAGEARFLRAHYYFDLRRIFRLVPYVDETTEDFNVPNNTDVYPKIEEDLQFAITNLPDNQDEVGRANKMVARAYLARVFMYQNKLSEAKDLLDGPDGVVGSGRFALLPNFFDNFNAATENGSESIFAVQFSVNDGTPNSSNGNWGDRLNFPHGGASPFGCCGFFQPTQNMVNAFQTDAVTGLPLLDTFNDSDVVNDQGLISDLPFTEHTGPVDPRLDWTVGRRGIPFLGFGDHPGADWIREQAFMGPYSPKKNTYSADQQDVFSSTSGWSGTNVTANNYNIIRYADVLLWRAEIAVEDNELELARTLVNQIRNRAINSEWVTEADGTTPAANYVIMEYPAGAVAFQSQEEARKAVRFERRLELAMEGHRFFDLIRWDIDVSTLNTYLAVEAQKRPFLSGATYEAEDAYQPIPQAEIDASQNVLQQTR